MERNARHDDPRTEEESPFDQKCSLVVEQVLPELRGDELGQDDGHVVSRIRRLQLVNVFQQRLH